MGIGIFHFILFGGEGGFGADLVSEIESPSYALDIPLHITGGCQDHVSKSLDFEVSKLATWQIFTLNYEKIRYVEKVGITLAIPHSCIPAIIFQVVIFEPTTSKPNVPRSSVPDKSG